jgi:hypothetical protein
MGFSLFSSEVADEYPSMYLDLFDINNHQHKMLNFQKSKQVSTVESEVS